MKKFAFIGAGSLQFTSSCVRDLLTFPAFKESEFMLMDINAENLKRIEGIVNTIIEKMHCPTEQKLELVDAVVNGIKAEKKAAKV